MPPCVAHTLFPAQLGVYMLGKCSTELNPLVTFLPFFSQEILGGANTPYEKGIFTLEVIVPER